MRQRARAVAMGGAWVESGLLLSHASAFQFQITRLESSVRVGGCPSIVWQPEIAAPATADWHRETFHGTKDYNKIYLGNLGSGQAPARAGGGANFFFNSIQIRVLRETQDRSQDRPLGVRARHRDVTARRGRRAVMGE